MLDTIRMTLSWIEQEYPPGSEVAVSPEALAFFTKQTSSKPVPPTPADPMPEIRALVSKAAPSFKLRKEPLSEPEVRESGKELHAAILSMGDQGNFLKNVADAVTALLGPCRVIEQGKWETVSQIKNLKLILGPPISKWKTTPLAAHFRENPTLNESSLFNIPFLPLQPIENYLKNPDLKRNLWKSLVSRLSS